MMKIAQIPRIVLIYGMTALMILLTSIFTSGSLDIAMYDTYFVISKVQLIIVTALLFVLFTIVTWAVEKMLGRLSSVLNWLHYGLTIISLVILVVLTNKVTSHPIIYRDYSVFDEIEEYKSQTSINEWIAIIVVIFILSQALFLINIIRAIIVRRKS